MTITTNNNNKNTNNVPNQKKTKGRQKIEIKKLENKNSLQVAFSKRRCGLFNKAMELSVLCGAEVGVLVFSPNGKMYVIGQPDFDTLLNCYLNGEAPPLSNIPCVQELNKEFEDSVKELEKEKKKAKVIEEEKKVRKGFWWESERIDEMELDELQEYEKGLMKLRCNVASKVNEMMMMNQFMLPPPPPPAENDDLLGNMNVGSSSGCGFDLQFNQQHYRI